MLKTESANNSMAAASEHRRDRSDLAAIVAVAVAVALLHLLTNNRYGFHRDELQFVSDAMHLDWGFVAYPPLTPFLERVLIAIFGFSLGGLRLFSVLAQAGIVVTAGLIARTLGGSRLAQLTAAVAVALSPIALFEGTEFQYTTFEEFAWVLVTYGFVRLLREENERWWMWIGVFCGVGLMAKYTVAFFIAALLVGLLLTPARRFFMSRWFLFGCGITLLIVMPNIIWQVRHSLISLHFLEYIHARDLRWGRGSSGEFWAFQALACENGFALPLTIAGIIAAWRIARYRAISIAFIATILLFAFAKARGYYTGAVFPVVIAFGAVAMTLWMSSLRAVWRRLVYVLLWTGLLVFGGIATARLVPLASSGPLQAYALAHSGDLREEVGWDTFIQTIARVRGSLPPEQTSSIGIITANYGEQGAVEILGPRYGLPAPISLTNSAWLRGYPTPPPSTLIVTGLNADDANEEFTNCRLAAHVAYPQGLDNEESKYHPDIFLCGSPRLPWPEFWKKYQRFG